MIRLRFRGADWLPALMIIVIGLCAGVLLGMYLVAP
jgi:uncharacterized protein YneF (UPF0154 family)